MDVFVARQPIFDRRGRTCAYELLFRAGAVNVFDPATDPDRASLRVLDTSFFTLGLDGLTGGKRAFVNFTRQTLVDGYATLLSPSQIVVEILETVTPDAELLEACRALRRAWHTLALDDWVSDNGVTALLDVADIVKVDFTQNTPAQRAQVVRELRGRGLRLLAEKVETPEEAREAAAAGYEYLQGYFFAKPVLVAARDVPTAKLTLLQLLREIHQPDASFARIEQLITREVALTYKLLAYMNRVAFGVRRQVETVQQALLRLGEVGVKKWVTMVAVANMGLDKPIEVVVTSVVRAKFCETLALRAGPGERAPEAFLMGLFSALDVLLGRPLAEALETLPLAEDVRDGMLHGTGRFGTIRALVDAYEGGRWARVAALARQLGLDEAGLPAMYADAVATATSATIIPAA